MPGPLDGASCAAWLLAQQQATRGQPCTLTCKSGAQAGKSVTFTGVIGQDLLRLGAADQQRVVRTDADVIAARTDIVLGGAEYRPQRGDLIVTTLAGVSQSYEVRPPGQDEPPWRWEDQFQVMRRIHCHYLGAVL